MLRISEHFQFYHAHPEHSKRIQDAFGEVGEIETQATSLLFKQDTKRICVSFQKSDHSFVIESSYYIGLGWIKEWKKPVYIEPKLNHSNLKLDHLKMLTEALHEAENLYHLDDLMDIRFEEEWIEVEGDQVVHLTPFLIAQFLMTVRNIVRKGLKKDYYQVTNNLQSKVKGKILVTQQIRQNVVRNRMTHTVCSYQEYGIDTAANQFLKYVLRFITVYTSNLQEEQLKSVFQEHLAYNNGAFQLVSDSHFYQFDQKEFNPLYKEYNLAFQLGNQLLKLLDHNLTKATNSLQKYPPHWIDMSKLFELYVFKKLRERFTGPDEVRYHEKINRQEPDFLICTENIKAVVDAKYKPRYTSGNPSMDDARQLAGYARLTKVYERLKVEKNEIIPVYFVYPSELALEQTDSEITEDNFNERTNGGLFGVNDQVRKSSTYLEMYLQEISMESNNLIS